MPARDEAALDRPHDRGARRPGPRARRRRRRRSVERRHARRRRARGRAAASRCASSRASRCREGWAGKLWALEQGLAVVDRPYVLLLDADIELAPRLVPALLAAAARARRDARVADGRAPLRDVLGAPAEPRVRVLLQAAVSVCVEQRRAEGHGGRGRRLHARAHRQRCGDIGGFAAIRGALIDDCTLAAALKRARPADLARHEPFGAQPARLRRARRLLEHGEPQRVHAASLLDGVAARRDGAHGA